MVLLVVLLSTPTRLRAQATTSVPLSAIVYRDLDALAGAGLIDSMLVGVRPYSRREVVRLLREAQRNVARLSGAHGWAERMIAAHLERYDRAPVAAVESARIDGTYLDSPPRAIPADSNGRVDAALNPIVAFREGRPLYDGATAAFESRHAAELGPWLALFVEPRITTASRRGLGEATTIARLQAGAVDFLFGNLSISAGREAVVFGQAPTGGLVLSSNAPPLDRVRVGNDRPAKLPWILGLLGPVRGTAFIADLGPHQNYPHAKLIGYKLSMAIHPQFELGAQVVDQMGGRGSPAGLFRDRLYDLVPLIDIFRTSGDYQFSNKFAGIDFRWRLPRARGFELFFDGALDDLDSRRWKSTFLEDAGYIAGFSFACLVECGRTTLRAEYHQTGIRYYTHTQFTSGIAQNRVLLGDPLGPRGLGSYLSIDRSDDRVGTVALAGAFEVRSGNRYGVAVTGPQERGFHFVLLERHPAESRARALLSWTSPARRPHVSTNLATGIERTTNFSFVDGFRRTNFIAQVGVEVHP